MENSPVVEANRTFEEEFNVNIQKKFLSLLVFDKTWADLTGFSVIQPKCFENTILNHICYWITDYHRKYKTSPTKMICCKLMEEFINNNHLGTKDYYLYKQFIDDIFELNEGDNLDFYKDKAVEFTRKVAWKNLLEKGGETLKIGNYQEAIDSFRKILAIGSENDLGIDMSKITVDEFFKGLSESYDKDNMLSTGIPDWDAALGGGFVKNNIHIIAAPPGGGKSRTMAYLAKTALMARKRVIFITLELTQDETLANIYTSATGMCLHDMMDERNRMEFIEKLTNFKNAYGSELMVKFYKPNSITTDTIHNYIQKVMQTKKEETGVDWKPDVIFLDYMDKLLPTQRMRNDAYIDGGLIATDCKNLAISFGVPCITGSQLGRYVWNLKDDNVVAMDSVAESAQKVHLAHSMTTLNSNPAEKEQSKVRLFMAKTRTGYAGKVIYCKNDLARCQLRQIPEWDPKTMQQKESFSFKDPNTRN